MTRAAERWRSAADTLPPTKAPDPVGSGPLTAAELCRVFGVSPASTARRIRALVDAGRVRVTSKNIRMIDGRVRAVVAYELLEAPKVAA